MKGDLDALFQHGDTVAGQLVPARFGLTEKVGGNARRDRHNGIFYDSERADICLNCPLPTCHGTRKCFRAMRDHPAEKIARAEKLMKPKPVAKKKSRKRKKSDPLDLDLPDFGEMNSFFDELDQLDRELEQYFDLDLPDFDINPEK